MRRFVLLGVVGAVAVGLAAPASAAPVAREYPNCSAMYRDYPSGVAKSASAARAAAQSGKRLPTVSRAVYRLNTKSDRDHDGVACERS